MSYSVSVVAAAEQDIWEAALFYENQKPGLGFAFLEELDNAQSKPSSQPQHYAYISAEKTLRQLSLHRFPYKIIFEVRKDHVVVLVVHHEKRKPFL